MVGETLIHCVSELTVRVFGYVRPAIPSTAYTAGGAKSRAAERTSVYERLCQVTELCLQLRSTSSANNEPVVWDSHYAHTSH